MKRLVIAIDCDDVLIPSSPAIVAHYNQTYQTSVHVDQFYDEDTLLWGVPDKEEKYIRIRKYFQSEEFRIQVIPFREAIEAVAHLADKHELHLVTGRSQTVDMVTAEMIERYFSGIFKSVEHTGSVRQPDGSVVRRTKGEVCRQLGVDVLIDDNLDHARSVLDSGTATVLLSGEYGWNRGELMAGVTRCSNWDDVVQQIESLEYAA